MTNLAANRVRLLGLCVGLAAALPSGAWAQSKCLSLKFKAFGAAAKVKANCHARAAKAGVPVDAACLATADAKLAKKWAKASGLSDCATSGSGSAAATSVATCIAGLAAVADPPPPPPGEPCCRFADGTCGHGATTTAVCTALGGTLGVTGSVCDGSTGTCVLTAPSGGRCCMEAGGAFCTAGPALDLSGCVPPSFLDAPFDATCAPNGSCTLL